jgi:ABC-type polysaccharide/polyol phosphate transport system ATPase subunit
MKAISFKDVWQMYRIKFVINGKISREEFWALKGINFETTAGESLGIIGENGAGKSTILKLIAGMLEPDRGEVRVKGNVSGLLELGAGFETELTGAENINLIAGLFGLSQAQIGERFEDIINFASIGKFIHAPVKCYSQGMFVRLAFAIAIHINPDILLIDDTLSVGDEYFQTKCIKKIFELKEQGKSIIVVSHDMNMLTRICKRVIYLKEGRIVRDGSSDKVMPLYTQMVGQKQGVCILERGPLSVVFNNGRLFLNWQDRLITPHSGAYTNFLIGNKWYSSAQADWEVRKDGQDKLVACGRFHQLSLTQVWRLELNEGYEIKCDIEMESETPVQISQGCTNMMLINEYKNWFTPFEEGEFLNIHEKEKEWSAFLDGNILRRCIGVAAPGTADIKFPVVSIEQSNCQLQGEAQIFNTDYFTNCRVLQYKALELHNYSANQSDCFLYFSGKIKINIPDINLYLEKLQDEFIVSCGKLKLVFNNGKGLLFYNDTLLTKDSHINTSIYVKGKQYPSNLAYWEVKKENRNKLIAKGTWSNLDLVQIWEIEAQEDSSFLFRVSLQANSVMEIEEQHIKFVCCDEYGYWFSEYGQGYFPDKFQEREIDVIQKCIPSGVIGITSQNPRFPGLALSFSKELNNFARIINSDFYSKSRALRIDKVEPEPAFQLKPGEYQSLSVKITANKYQQDLPGPSSNSLSNSALNLLFDNGSGRIYWKTNQITKRLGLYTSLRSQGRWYDSASSAIWQIEQNCTDSLRLIGKWLNLPIIQYWQVKVIGERDIEWEVRLTVKEQIEVDRSQANIMLSERYSDWLTDEQRGSFPDFKEDVNDDWDRICTGEDIKYIGVVQNCSIELSLPQVVFYPTNLEPGWSLNILNSDIYHRGRVLQCLNRQKKVVLSGEYPFYKGVIKIGEFKGEY